MKLEKRKIHFMTLMSSVLTALMLVIISPTYVQAATHCHSVGPAGQGFMVGTKQLGNWCSYHQNGRLSMETPYAHGVRHGISRSYHSNGYKSRETSYWNGKKNGVSLVWWSNGDIKSKHYYEDNKLHGEARTWYQNGNPSTCWIYNYGKKDYKCPL